MKPFLKKFAFVLLYSTVCFLSAPVHAQSLVVDFELSDIHGKMHRLSDYRGQWVIVNFWATWCAPCLEEIPMLRELAKMEEPVKPVVIGIDFEEIEKEPLQKFIEEFEIDYLVLLIGDTPLIPFEPLKGMPTTFVVSPEGKIVYRHVGLVTKETLVNVLSKYSQ